MQKYKAYISEVQTWVYVYEVEANSEDEAREKAEALFYDGYPSSDNWIDNTSVDHVEIEEA